jgi:hypothetical protein
VAEHTDAVFNAFAGIEASHSEQNALPSTDAAKPKGQGEHDKEVPLLA